MGKWEPCGKGTPRHQSLPASAACSGAIPSPNVSWAYCVPGQAPGREGTRITSARYELLLGALGRPEGFLEAVTFCRALKGTFIHSVKSIYWRLLCARPSGLYILALKDMCQNF